MKEMQPLVIFFMCGIRAAASEETHPSSPYQKGVTFKKLPLDDVVTSQDVLSQESVRSDTDCGRKCVDAGLCAVFTFQPNQNGPSGHCLLYGQMPSSTEDLEDSLGARTYAVHMSHCDKSDVVLDAVDASVSWKPSGTEGDLVCHSDYIYSRDNPTILCTPSGEWSVPDGSCLQSVWRNISLQTKRKFDFPRSLYVGWATCIWGIACSSCGRLAFSLAESWDKYPAHVPVRFNCAGDQNKLAALYRLNNAYKMRSAVYANSFPFAHGEFFEIELRLLSMKKLQVSVNGSVMIVYNSSLSFEAVSFLLIDDKNDDTSLELVDLWSGCY